MTTWMEPFAFWLADFYLAATLLLSAAVAIFALVKQPSRRMAVAWGIVPGLLLAACFCLFASRPHVRLWPATPVETERTEVVSDVSPAPAGPIVGKAYPDPMEEPERMRYLSIELPSDSVEPAAPIAALPELATVREAGPAAWASRLVAVFVWTFLAGSLLVTSRLALGVWRASRLVRESEPASSDCVNELHAIVGTTGRGPRLRVNRRLLTPVATGAVRPAILLPEESSRPDQPHALRAVLAHEWTHIKNGDLRLLAFDRIVLSLLWAHPLYWWTRRRIRADQEFLADAAAAAQIGSADYAALLVQWARKVTEQRSLAAVTAVGIWERPAGLTDRVTVLLAGSEATRARMSGRTRVGVAMVLALMSLLTATVSLRPPQTELARAEEKPTAVPATPTVVSPTVLARAEAPVRREVPQTESALNDVQGTCHDKQGKPLAGVQVFLYAIQKLSGREQLLRQGTTDADGRFRFRDCLGKKVVQLSWQVHDEDGAIFEIFARRADLGTGVKTLQWRDQELEFTLTEAASLTGTVRDGQGRPVAGTIVREMYQPLPKTGWLSAKSDDNGNFTIADLSAFEYFGPSVAPGPRLGLLSVEHPNYGTAKASYNRVPGHVDIVLGKPATIEGTVVYGDTGKPAAGISIFANRIEEPFPAVSVDLPDAKTDKNGRYTLRPLPAGLFNLSASTMSFTGILSFAKGNHSWVAAPIEAFRTEEGKTAAAPPIRLVKGGMLKGSLYQYRRGEAGVHEPVKLEENEKQEIIVFYGPSVPAVPGSVADMTFVRSDGTFELRLPPGMHYLCLPSAQKADGTYRLPYCDMGEPCTEEDAAPPQLNKLHRIKIREGQTTEVDISVFRPSPPRKTAADKKSQIEQPNATQLAEAPKPTDKRTDSRAIAGTFVDQRSSPVRGAQVSLYRVNWQEMTQQLVGQTSTDEAGRFEFPRSLAGRAGKDNLRIVVRHEGLATLTVVGRQLGKSLDFVMAPAATLKGTVRDAAGKPVVGALVNFGSFQSVTLFPLPIEGIRSARTDAKGRFAVTDLEEFKYKRSLPPRNWHGGWASSGPPSMTIVHPDYAQARVKYDEVPADVDVVLTDRAGTIEGQVITAETGKPAAGVTLACECTRPGEFIRKVAQTGPDGHYRVTSLPAGSYSVWVSSSPTDQTAPLIESLTVNPGRTAQAPVMRLVKGGVIEGQIVDPITGKHGAGITVHLQGIYQQQGKASSYSDRTMTDPRGHYRFASLPGGKFNLFIDNEHLDAAAAAIDSFQLRAGQTATAPPIRLVRGGLIKGLIIDDATGKAVRLRPGEYLDIQSHGPARPRSGAAVQVAKIRADGTFEIRLPPGDSWLGVRGGNEFEITGEGGGEYSLSDRSEINVEYHVRRHDPSKEPASKLLNRKEPLAEHEPYTTKIVDYHIAKDEIGGMCLSGDEARIQGVEVTLYIRSLGGRGANISPKRIDQTTTNDEGQFVFRHVPPMDPREADYLVVARRHGRMTAVGTLNHRHDWLDLKLPAARPFKGIVQDVHGSPVSGALVRCDQSAWYSLPEGIQSARTNARGEFNIDDDFGVGRCVIEHPDFARKTLNGAEIKYPLEVTLDKRGSIIEGRVVSEIGGSVAALLVDLQGISRQNEDARHFFAQATTDREGNFQLRSLPPGKFNVFVASEIRGGAALALDSLEVGADQKVLAPPIRIVKPGVVKGRLIDDATGQAAPVGDDERVPIGVHGPSRPRSGAAVEMFPMKTDGTFELQLPPGKNLVYVAGGPFLVRKPGDPSANQDIRQIDVKEGTETTIEFRVIRQVPIKQAPKKPIKSSPVPATGAVNRPELIMMAEAPTVLPKIVADHLEQDAVGGVCLGFDKARIAGVDVSLYVIHRVKSEERTHELIGRTITNDEGQFVFLHVPDVTPGDESYEFIARRHGNGTTIGHLNQRHGWVKLWMPPGAAVKGIVKDEQGQPIADVQIRVNWNREHALPEGVLKSRTNARGEFEIDDAPEVAVFHVAHPDYLSDGFTTGAKLSPHSRMLQSPVEVTLKRAGVIEGQVLDGETGQPLPGALVTMQRLGQSEDVRVRPMIGHRSVAQLSHGLTVTTDRQGRYKFGSLPPDMFNLAFRSGPGGATSASIDALSVGPAQAVEVPPVRLARGAIVAVRLIDNLRGRLVNMDADETVVIGIRSVEGNTGTFAKPRLKTLHMRQDGTIGVWLPAGKHAISLSGGPYFSIGDAAQGQGHDVREIEINGTEEPAVEFRVVQIAHRHAGLQPAH